MPQKYSYHWEIRDLLIQFLHAFDGAVVKRYDNQRNPGNTVGVRYVYSPKQRVLHDLINKAQHITIPAVAYWITSISRDNSRVFNKLEGRNAINSIDYSRSNKLLQPVPVNIEVNVSILTRFQSDMDQILSNFVPYSDPYFIISWERDGMPGIEIRTEVLWSNNLAMGYPAEQNDTQPTRVTCDTSFTIKGWLFKADADPIGRIFKIDSNFYAVSATPTMENYFGLTDPSTTESFVLSATPQIVYSSRWLAEQMVSGTVDLFGDMLSYTTAVYLSANNSILFGAPTVFNPFSAVPSLSAAYPAISGIPAPSYTIDSNNKLSLLYPPPLSTGNFDIIVVNPAGYAKLTTGSYNVNYNLQFPYVNGIMIYDPLYVDPNIYFVDGHPMMFISGEAVTYVA